MRPSIRLSLEVSPISLPFPRPVPITFTEGSSKTFRTPALDAADFFSHQQNVIKMNNFGIYMGGPVVIPKLYNGRDKTFFFGSFEALRLPKSQTDVESVPTLAMRSGDLSSYLSAANGGAAEPVDWLSRECHPSQYAFAFFAEGAEHLFPAAKLWAGRRDCE